MSELATYLREGTKNAHSLAESTVFMRCFLKSYVEQQTFEKLLANLYLIYQELEQQLNHYRTHPIIGLIYFPVLLRTSSLEEDLVYYYGSNWQEKIVPSPAVNHYLSRIKEVAKTNPTLLVAHAYVRYMGDLSGGQGLKHIARKAYKLPDNRGTQFYEFSGLPTPEDKRNFKFKYRDILNVLPVQSNIIPAIVEEANLAFSLNCELLQELENEVKEGIDADTLHSIMSEKHEPSLDAPVRPVAGVA